MNDISALFNGEYKTTLSDIVEKIKKSRYKMLKEINHQTIDLYWNIGRIVCLRIQENKWGKSVVEKLSKDLQREFPGVRGFSSRNIWRMNVFYETYSHFEILPPVVAEIGWTQNYLIIEKCKDEKERLFYLKQSHLICRDKDRVVVEYLLNAQNQPLGVATYNKIHHLKEIPKEIAQYLPSESEINEKLGLLIDSSNKEM